MPQDCRQIKRVMYVMILIIIIIIIIKSIIVIIIIMIIIMIIIIIIILFCCLIVNNNKHDDIKQNRALLDVESKVRKQMNAQDRTLSDLHHKVPNSTHTHTHMSSLS